MTCEGELFLRTMVINSFCLAHKIQRLRNKDNVLSPLLCLIKFVKKEFHHSNIILVKLNNK